MPATRVFIIAILAALAGAFLALGINTLTQRQASAQPLELNPAGSADPVVAAKPAVGSVGPGGSFVTDVYNSVSPAVVHITNRMVQYDMFFGQYESEATGSGVIIDDRGYILTNQHVTSDAKEIFVVTTDGRQYEAKLVGADPGTDLALVKIETKEKLPVAKLGESSSLQVGEWVVAIGNPRGLDWTVTVGVVSALGREQPSPNGQTIYNLIQTDAAINPGNSGGPLLNVKGEVIGINERIVSSGGGSEGIGLAIPINTAKEIVEDLIKYGRVIRPWLGIEIKLQVNPARARYYDFPVDYGIIPAQVYRDSPAAKAGIVPVMSNGREFRYDIITSIDGEKLDNDREILDIIRNHKTGDTVKLEIYRITNGTHEKIEVSTVLTELPAEAPLAGVI